MMMKNLLFPKLLTFLALIVNATAITPNAVEVQIANLIKNHSGQQRTEMVYDETLNFVARQKALDMATRGYQAHVDPDGYGYNKAILLAGYALPSYYPSDNDSNNVESLGFGYADAQEVVSEWAVSPSHKLHVLGEHSFFAGQTRYGVGYVDFPNDPENFTRYYVFLSAHPGTNGDEPLDAYAEWQFTHFPTPLQVDTLVDEADPDGNGIPHIFEFALGYTPGQNVSIPTPSVSKATNQLQWNLPVVADLGSVLFEVQHTADLSAGSFSSNNVSKSGNTYTAPAGAKGFMQLFAERQ